MVMFGAIAKLAAFAIAASALGVQDVLDSLKNADPSFKSPGLTYLYNANITGTGMIFLGQGPRGTRIVAPITGGAFVGPKLKGKFLPIGADWALADANDPTGSIAIEARHTLETDDGAVIQVFERGSTQPDGTGLVSLSYETGHPGYYWINSIVGVGIMRSTGANSAEQHTWHLTIEPATPPEKTEL